MAVIPPTWWRFLVMALLGVVSMGVSVWYYGLTEGEKSYVRSKLNRK
jgi:hypothetical protein